MKQVLITGISGWIAQYCAVECIKAGYLVKGSLRSKRRIAEVEKALNKEVNTAGKLSFCELDLLKDDGWDDAMQGCDYLMHVASPFILKEPTHEDELIKPAQEGTLRALRAAQKAGIKRVVLTASILSMAAHMTEGSFNSQSWTDLGDENLTAYEKSKTIAERAAWNFIEDHQQSDNSFELVVINPGSVMGPTLGTDLGGASLDICKQLIQRKMPAIPDIKFVMVDVRDVAKLHMKALSLPGAKGKRFIAAHDTPTSLMQMAQFVKNIGFKVSTVKLPFLVARILAFFNAQVKNSLPYIGRSVSCDNSETIKLFDWEPIPIQKTIEDMAFSVKAVLDAQK